MTSISRARRVDVGTWIRHGILAGIVAGVVFAMFEMVLAAILGGAEALFMPLRMIGGMALGPTAMDPATSILTAGGAGLVVHMVLSMMYGVATAAALSLVPQLSASRTLVIGSASLAGLALWIVNFYVFAPIFGWLWFPNETNVVVQFVAHVFFFGSVLGWVLDQTLFARLRTEPA